MDRSKGSRPARKAGVLAALVLAGAAWNAGQTENVRAWGDNSHGQLGNGFSAANSHLKAAEPVSNLAGTVAIAAGGWHSLALKNDGTVRA